MILSKSFMTKTQNSILLKRNKLVDYLVADNQIDRKNSIFKALNQNYEKSDVEIIVEGESLAILLQDENHELFGNIIKTASVVLACRTTPKQKAQIITFTKSIDKNMISLAIGDGANDVSMIKEADVGIGIFGKEGYQAVSVSDYAIGEFQFLRRLMFFHGRFFTKRIQVFITQFLVKNQLFTIPQFFFAFYSAYSGFNFWEPGYYISYNIFGSQLILGYLGVADRDIEFNLKDNTIKLLLPYLYDESRTKVNQRQFVYWYSYGFYLSIVCFFVAYYGYDFALAPDGLIFDFWHLTF